MSLTKIQKALVENLLMIIDEEVMTWSAEKVKALNMLLKIGFDRVKASLHHKKSDSNSWPGTIIITKIVGREVRRIRAYTDISLNSVIEVLDVVYDILTEE